MTAREAARSEWKKLKGKPLKEKLIHIGTYYWPHILTIVVCLSVVISFISASVGNKESAFYAYFLNATALSDVQEQFEATFATYAGIDQDTYAVSIFPGSTDLSGGVDMTAQFVAAQTAAGSLDALCAQLDDFLQYAYQDYFFDLRDILTPQQQLDWEPYLLYIDQTVFDAIAVGGLTSYALPDPTQPELMEDPVPIAVMIPQSSVIRQSYALPDGTVAIGIVVNSSHAETAVQFLEFLLS